MKTRTFKGESVHALMRQAREELGDNVVILGTRETGEEGVEIEIGLIEDSRDSASRIVDNPEPSLSVLADLYRETNVWSALTLNGLSAELIAACDPYLRATDQLDRSAASSLTKRGTKRAGSAAGFLGGTVVDSERLGKALGKVLQFNPALPFTSRVVGLVGPAGAGKTTSIAKLTARLQLAFGIKIGLIAGDSYRIGAEFHLGAFAKLLGVPLATLNGNIPPHARLQEALARLEGCDLVFVDTPGSGPFDTDRLKELRELFGRAPEMEKLLVLPAPGNQFDLDKARAAYMELGISRVMITKVDESGYLGPVLNTVFEAGLPLAFIATGQRVPEDIEPASARRLAWMLMRRMH